MLTKQTNYSWINIQYSAHHNNSNNITWKSTLLLWIFIIYYMFQIDNYEKCNRLKILFKGSNYQISIKMLILFNQVTNTKKIKYLNEKLIYWKLIEKNWDDPLTNKYDKSHMTIVILWFKKDVRKMITTPMGKLRGRVQSYKSGQKGTYYSFRGIRYGLPPVGNRR